MTTSQANEREGSGSIRPVTAVRGSLLIAVDEVLRERRLDARHRALLPERARAATDGVVAHDRVPIEVAHDYLACIDDLGLSRSDQVQCGRALARRLHLPIVVTGLRVAGALGMLPLVYAKLGERVWHRRNDGGAFRCDVRSARDGVVSIQGYPLASIGFIQSAWEGVIAETLSLSGHRLIVTMAAEASSSTSLVYAVRWL